MTKKIIKLGAPWCAACRAISPMYEGLKNEYASKVSLEDVDVDETPAIAEKYGVTSLPTILFIKGEDVVDSHKGALTKSALKGKIDNFLS